MGLGSGVEPWNMPPDPDDTLIELMGEAIVEASDLPAPRPMPLAYWEAECALRALRTAGYEVRLINGDVR